MKVIFALALFAAVTQAMSPSDFMISIISSLMDQAEVPGYQVSNIYRHHNERPVEDQRGPCCPCDKPKAVPQSPLAGLTTDDDGGRIINGAPAKRGQFPWQAFIQMDNKMMCGGSIISAKWILTAGHCVAPHQTFRVILGANNVLSPEEGHIDLATRDGIVHKEYVASIKANDIGLLKLPQLIKFSEYIRPVTLPSYSFASKPLDGVGVRVSGWGWTSNTGDSSIILRFADVHVITHKECASVYEQHTQLNPDRQLCTMGEAAKSACRGDSGGALTMMVNDRRIQVGLVSFGHHEGCSVRPKVYTRVTGYLDWIENNTGIAIEKRTSPSTFWL